jgi:hypothetical protein
MKPSCRSVLNLIDGPVHYGHACSVTKYETTYAKLGWPKLQDQHDYLNFHHSASVAWHSLFSVNRAGGKHGRQIRPLPAKFT